MKSYYSVYVFPIISALVIFLLLGVKAGTPEFTIDFGNNTFVKDGKPFRYVSGSVHYTRIHPYYWQDRLQKLRAAGLNAVQTFVPWNAHETAPGTFKWDGFSDLEKFLNLANQENLVVLLRLGPYICGEWEFGGFPAWLLTENPNMILRTSDPAYMKWVTLWFQELLPKVKRFLYKNGGPVVMVQIENEYGSYFACDRNYMLNLRDMVTDALGSDVIIYTTDGSGDGFLKCGKTPNVYATVDFGVTYNAFNSFQPQRDYEPKGPLVNSEFYTGWLDHWGDPHSKTNAIKVSKSLDILLGYNRSNINMYMFVGGTNFGFWNGANEPPYQPVPTSYDYDAPISEAGDISTKFFAIRDIISKYLPLPESDIPSNTTKMNYGPVEMKFRCTIQDSLEVLCPNGPASSKYPIPMEKIKFYHGFILYRHILTSNVTEMTELHTWGIRDRAMVMIDGMPQGILDRTLQLSVNVTGHKGQYLDILVENQGRVGFSTDMNFNSKGLIANVSLGGKVLTDWLLYPLDFKNLNNLKAMGRSGNLRSPQRSRDGRLMTPSFYIGLLTSKNIELQDTFLDPLLFTKGQVFLNDFNLGRYWPKRGPQVRLFTPKPVFLPKTAENGTTNTFFVFEVENAPCFNFTSGCSISLVNKPYLDGPVKSITKDDMFYSSLKTQTTDVTLETKWQPSFYKIH